MYLKPFSITSMLDMPISHKGKIVGIVCCEHQWIIRNWLPDKLTFVSSLSDFCGRAINALERNEVRTKLTGFKMDMKGSKKLVSNSQPMPLVARVSPSQSLLFNSENNSKNRKRWSVFCWIKNGSCIRLFFKRWRFIGLKSKCLIQLQPYQHPNVRIWTPPILQR